MTETNEKPELLPPRRSQSGGNCCKQCHFYFLRRFDWSVCDLHEKMVFADDTCDDWKPSELIQPVPETGA